MIRSVLSLSQLFSCKTSTATVSDEAVEKFNSSLLTEKAEAASKSLYEMTGFSSGAERNRIQNAAFNPQHSSQTAKKRTHSPGSATLNQAQDTHSPTALNLKRLSLRRLEIIPNLLQYPDNHHHHQLQLQHKFFQRSPSIQPASLTHHLLSHHQMMTFRSYPRLPSTATAAAAAAYPSNLRSFPICESAAASLNRGISCTRLPTLAANPRLPLDLAQHAFSLRAAEQPAESKQQFISNLKLPGESHSTPRSSFHPPPSAAETAAAAAAAETVKSGSSRKPLQLLLLRQPTRRRPKHSSYPQLPTSPQPSSSTFLSPTSLAYHYLGFSVVLDDLLLEFPEIPLHFNVPEDARTFTWPNGVSYKGGWKNGELNGVGKMTYPKGSFYEGHFKAGMFEGLGRFKYENGSVHEGSFHKCKKEGYGIYTEAGGVKYRGFFMDDQFDGKGWLTWSDGDYYVGFFSNGRQHGLGWYEWVYGIQYYGGWSDGKKKGYGILWWPDGCFYRGEFNGDKFADGTVSIRKHGEGTTAKLKWKNGVCIGDVDEKEMRLSSS